MKAMVRLERERVKQKVSVAAHLFFSTSAFRSCPSSLHPHLFKVMDVGGARRDGGAVGGWGEGCTNMLKVTFPWSLDAI